MQKRVFRALSNKSGFTIVELLVVLVVIGILASLTFVLYTGVMTKVTDASISADAESMNSSELLYKLSHGSISKAYYSGNGPDSELNFSPKTGNFIDVVTSGKEFCIRVYNPKGTKNSIHNAYQVESSVGMCSQLPPSDEAAAVPVIPDAPTITVALVDSNIVATITPVTCLVGSAEYGINNRTNDGAWAGYTAWSTNTTATQVANQNVKYGYRAQARCYLSYSSLYSDAAIGIESTFTTLTTPAAPSVGVVLNGANVQATINAVTCSSGTAQYAINSRTNDGAWGSYSSWSTTTVSTQTANEIIKYGYKAESRCYVDSSNYGLAAEGSEATYTQPPNAPSAPTIAVALNAGNVVATITPVTCTAGTSQYAINSRTNDGAWDGYTAWSTTLTASRAPTEGVKYGYKASARCYSSAILISTSIEGTEANYTHPVNAPSAPTTAVAANGGNVQATITPITCTAGTPQYGLSSRTNDGTWGSYSAWSTSTTDSQAATEGVKYGYKAQARCYLDASNISQTTTGSEGTYIQPIATVPTVPTASWTANTWPNTVYSWTTPSCPAGMSVTYRYDYTYTGGYDSGWQIFAGNSVSFSTSTATYTYSLSVQARCYNSYADGNWSASGSTSYYRSNSAIIGAWGGGAAGGNSGAGDGGGGGAYSLKTMSVASGSYSVVVGGVSGDSYFINTGTVLAKGGAGSGGGNSASGVGDVKYSGGNGSIHYNGGTNWHGGGGGGAAGPDGNGGNGLNSGTNQCEYGGAGDNGSGGAGGPKGGLNATGPAGTGNVKGGGGGAGVQGNGAGGGGGTPGGGGGGGNNGSGAGTAGQVQIYYPTGSMSGTGGSITTGGGNTYHTFTGGGTFQVY